MTHGRTTIIVSIIEKVFKYVLPGCLNRFKFFIHSRLDSCLIFGISWTDFLIF